MSQAMTHQERAESAYYALVIARPPNRPKVKRSNIDVIARETLPTELIGAAQGVLSLAEQYFPTWESDALEDLRFALALYPTEEGKEGGDG